MSRTMDKNFSPMLPAFSRRREMLQEIRRRHITCGVAIDGRIDRGGEVCSILVVSINRGVVHVVDSPPAEHAWILVCPIRLGGVIDVNQCANSVPLIRIGKTLGKDISTHSVRRLLDERELRFAETLMQPADTHSVSASKMPHGRITTSLADPNHGRVIFMEEAANRWILCKQRP